MSRTPDLSSDYTGLRSDPGPNSDTPPGVPLWVKVLAVIAAALCLLVLVLLLTGLGGEHGPGRHTGADTSPTVGVTVEETAPGGGT